MRPTRAVHGLCTEGQPSFATIPVCSFSLSCAQTVEGSVHYMRQSDENINTLRNDITSPGGTTAAAIYSLEKVSVLCIRQGDSPQEGNRRSPLLTARRHPPKLTAAQLHSFELRVRRPTAHQPLLFAIAGRVPHRALGRRLGGVPAQPRTGRRGLERGAWPLAPPGRPVAVPEPCVYCTWHVSVL